MEEEKSLNFKNVDFADANILTYIVSGDNLTLSLESWNGEIFEIKFLKYVSLFSTNYFRISSLEEVFESSLLEQALTEFYEVRPEKHNFRIFKFLHDVDIITLEIICEDISIKNISSKS